MRIEQLKDLGPCDRFMEFDLNGEKHIQSEVVEFFGNRDVTLRSMVQALRATRNRPWRMGTWLDILSDEFWICLCFLSSGELFELATGWRGESLARTRYYWELLFHNQVPVVDSLVKRIGSRRKIRNTCLPQLRRFMHDSVFDVPQSKKGACK